MITENCEVIINSAASVNFDDPILEAIQINYMGCQRMLALAKECKKLLVFTHVSTAYVNCNRDGRIEEKIYEDTLDSESLIKSIQALSPAQAAEREKQILGGYPNTYTYTKSMAERTLAKNKGDLPVVLYRPSIIACSMEQPF